jgi:hypothetical protein
MVALEAVAVEVRRLGGTLGEPISTEAFLAELGVWDGTNHRLWEKVDPLGQLVEVSEAIRRYVSIAWPEGKYQIPHRDEPEWMLGFDFHGTSSNLELSDQKRRLVLHQFGYSETTGSMFAFDLFDRQDDPMVYKLTDPTEVGEAIPWGKFSQFLARVAVAT